jgi:hypothetical protein
MRTRLKISGIIVFLLVAAFLQIKTAKQSDITIDLNKKTAQLLYSSFIDSLYYVTLNLSGDFILSGIERLYVDGDYLLIQDEKLGLFVFSLEKRLLIKVIDYFGNGPEEFYTIRAFTHNADKKQLLIYSYPFIHKYTYDGVFIESIKNENVNLVDLYYTNAGEYICIAPEDVGPNAPCGVWLADSTFQYVKTLKEIPSGQRLFTRSTFYNRTENGIYYYDRVWDDFSFITDSSVDILYRFDLKQRVPVEMRKHEHPFNELRRYSSIGEFVNSDRYILSNYFQFGTGEISWVLFDKANDKIICSTGLLNDMSTVSISSNKLFYINNRTWCRAVDFEENDTTITLEFISVKK